MVAIIGQWMLAQEPATIARLAVDSKTLRGSGRRDGKPLQLFSAVTHHLRMTLQQVPIEKKTNEIPNFKPLLRAVKPTPCTASRSRPGAWLRSSVGTYLFGLKGNQDGILSHAERLQAQQVFSP
ncbi:MAG: hypothetical protein EXS25_11590 [Pedosphaera sp.]|nr:hypothetical protein [Pedosphaera sp.]